MSNIWIQSLPSDSRLIAIYPSPYWTLLFPFRVIPYTDGRSWARRPGYEYHKGVRPEEEYTDEEEEYE